MHKGGLLLVSAAVLACTACMGDGGKLEIRSVESGLKAGRAPVPFRIAEARSHLALGNVGLALTGFRKAAREDPSSIEALAGIADCYVRMGRFDLSRRYYEQALALAPRDPALLAAFAGSLDRQGKAREAAAVRQEMAALAQPQAEAAAVETPAPAPVAAPAQVEVAAVELTPPAPVAHQPQAEIAPVQLPSPPPAPVARPVVATVTQAAPPPLAAPAPVGRSVTIALPPPRPVAAPNATVPAPAPQKMAVAPVGHSVTIALPPPRPAAVAKPATEVAAKVPGSQPRLVRLSLTEVALFTTDGPRWKKPEPQAARLAAVKPVELRILNAARIDKLAARTRAYLGNFGWRQAVIGDAARVRSRSLIVYPAGSRAAASKLSSRFGFPMAPRKDVRQLTILLGRDAARHPELQRKS